MMKNKKMIIFLVIIIIIQLSVPVTMLINYIVRTKEFNENYQEINVLIDGVYCNENHYTIYSNGMNDLYNQKYIVFEMTEDGFYRWKKTNEKPENNIYVTNYYTDEDFGYIEYKENELPEGYAWFDLESDILYHRWQEIDNIDDGKCDGPTTQAYMVLKVYKGMYEVKEVYINSIPLDEYYCKVHNDEIDIARFDYIYDSYDYDYDTDYYEYYDEEIGEYVTEPYVA